MLAVGILTKAKIIIPLTAAFFFILRIVNEVDPGGAATVFPPLADIWRLNFGFIFFIGATIAVYSDRIPFDHRWGIVAGLGSVALLRVGGFNTVGYFLFAYFVLYLAAALPKRLHWIGQKNDYSYGVYLYGWVVQQVLAFLGVYKLGYVPFVVSSLLAAGACAWVSWHLVEKQALKLKDWGPGRGIRYWWDWLSDRARRRNRPEPPIAEPVE
jgi:peptidoglycan/LPS O-acetylase OafA/YrhL